MRSFFLCLFLALSALSGINAGNDSPKKSIIIRLKDQMDVSSTRMYLASFPKELKREMAVQYLKEFSRQSQARFLSSIRSNSMEEDITDIKQFWIANIIACKATDEVIAKLKQRNDIEISADEKMQVLPEEFSVPYSASNTLAAEEIAANIKLVRAPEVNEQFGYTGKGVVVAILDSGVNYNHEDLKDALWEDENYPHHGWDFSYNDNDPMDDKGHGTHCAGTIVGNGKSGTRTGVALDARLMILKVLDKNGQGSEKNIFDAIQFAVDHGANVLSMSIGWDGSNQYKTWRDVMTNLLEFDVLAVVAAGNNGESISYYTLPYNIGLPGACPAAWLHPSQPNPSSTSSVITIGSVQENGVDPAKTSAYGPCSWQGVEGYDDYLYNPGEGLLKPDVCMQGVNVLSADWQNTQGYVRLSGTSMATPAVAGVVALMLSKNPDLKPAEIVQILSQSSVKITDSFDPQRGAGRVDAMWAIYGTPNLDFNCTKITVTETEGLKNGNLNPGDQADLSFTFRNDTGEDLSGYNLEITSLTPNIPITSKGISLPLLSAGKETIISNLYSLEVPQDATAQTTVDIAILVTKGDKKWTNLFHLPIGISKLANAEMKVKEIEGNDNDIMERGEKMELTFPITNIGNETAYGVKGKLIYDASYLTPIGATDTDALDLEINASNEFRYQFSINEDLPDWYNTQFTLQLKGENIDTTFTYEMDIDKTAILILDKTKNNLSSKDFAAYLDAQGSISYQIVTELPQSLDRYHSVWYFAGVYPKNGKITPKENEQLTQYLNKGGYVYMEGGDVWYTKKANMSTIFGVECLEDNTGAPLDKIAGCRENYTSGQNYIYTYDQKSIDEIIAVAPAYPVFSNKGSKDGVEKEFTAVIYNDPGTYRTIASVFEIGGILGDSENEAVNRYMEFFNIKKDGPVNISSSKVEKFKAECYKSGNYCIIELAIPTPAQTTISLLSIDGKLVKQIHTGNSGNMIHRIAVNDLKGIYLIRIQSGEQTVVKKVLL